MWHQSKDNQLEKSKYIHLVYHQLAYNGTWIAILRCAVEMSRLTVCDRVCAYILQVILHDACLEVHSGSRRTITVFGECPHVTAVLTQLC